MRKVKATSVEFVTCADCKTPVDRRKAVMVVIGNEKRLVCQNCAVMRGERRRRTR